MNKEERPNIIIILADDMGYGDIEPYGGWIGTPHINRIIEEGLKITDFHASGPVCSPTRAGLMTGRYQQRAGIESVLPVAQKHLNGLRKGEVTLPALLKEAGYATGLFGKWHLGHQEENHPLNHGFHEFIGYIGGNVDYVSHFDQVNGFDWWNGYSENREEGYVTHLVTSHSLEFIEKHREEPFFLYMAHEAPHYPYQGPGDRADRSGDNEFPIHGSRKDRKEAYREMVEEMDKGVGEILAKLEETGLDKDTLIIFFSDNGATPEGSNAPFRGGKGTLYEGGHRLPAAIRWPGRIKAGRETDALTISIDFMPTLLSLCGITPPAGRKLDGRDLSDLLDGDAPSELKDRNLFWRFKGQRAMRRGDFKMVQSGPDENPVLFNLAEDPSESTPLGEAHKDRLTSMTAEWEAWEKDVLSGFPINPQ